MQNDTTRVRYTSLDLDIPIEVELVEQTLVDPPLKTIAVLITDYRRAISLVGLVLLSAAIALASILWCSGYAAALIAGFIIGAAVWSTRDG
jgi:hypothetical protein